MIITIHHDGREHKLMRLTNITIINDQEGYKLMCLISGSYEDMRTTHDQRMITMGGSP